MKSTAFLLFGTLTVAYVIDKVVGANADMSVSSDYGHTYGVNDLKKFLKVKPRSIEYDYLPGGLSGGGVPGEPSHGLRSLRKKRLVKRVKRQSSSSTLETGKADERDIAHLGNGGEGLSSDPAARQRSHK